MPIDAQSRGDYFLQPRPAPNRLNPRLATAARRSLTALRRTLEQAPSEAVRAITLVEARQSSRIENVGGEPTPDGDNRPSRLYHALEAALSGAAGLLEQHQMLWDDLPADHPITPGQWRNCDIRVGSYFPPPPADVPAHMDAFQQWSQSDAEKADPLLAAVWGHAYFETIHPFADGNGRTGRIWVLQTLGLPLTISRSVYRRRREYYDGLQNAQWPQWQTYMLEVIAEAARETNYDLRRHNPEKAEAERVTDMAERWQAPQRGRRPISVEEARMRQLIQQLNSTSPKAP